MKPEPYWQPTKIPRHRRLGRSAKFDVAVVGGGITGLTTAYLLKKAGKRVCLLERDQIGNVDTGLTTAHLTYVTDERLPDLVKSFGEDAAALVWEAGATAIEQIETIVREERIACDFRRVPGYLCAALDERKNGDDLGRDAKLGNKLGFPCQRVKSVPVLRRPGVLFPNQAKFHPLKYLAGLAKAVHGDGSAIYENSAVEEIRDDPQRVVVGKHEVQAEFVVIATHTPLMGKTGLLSATLFQTKLAPYSSYAIGAKVPKGVVPEACFWDVGDPYYYLRVEHGKIGDYVIFGGEDHKTGQTTDTEERFKRLVAELHRFVPQAKPDRQWSGQVIETNDGLPYIGETAERQFAATGYGGNGMTFGTLAALMARDAALGRGNPWKKLFSVDRKKLRGGTWAYLTENVDYPYYYLKDRLTRTPKVTPRNLGPGDGAVLKVGGERMACSCDDGGKRTAVSPYCTHMGCLVHWNRAEKTWDCPCHGSRFRANGTVLAGPAEEPLKQISLPKKARKRRVAKPRLRAYPITVEPSPCRHP